MSRRRRILGVDDIDTAIVKAEQDWKAIVAAVVRRSDDYEPDPTELLTAEALLENLTKGYGALCGLSLIHAGLVRFSDLQPSLESCRVITFQISVLVVRLRQSAWRQSYLVLRPHTRVYTDVVDVHVAGTLRDVVLHAPEWPRWKPEPKPKPRARRGHVYSLFPSARGITIRGVKIPATGPVASLGDAFEAFAESLRGLLREGQKGLILLHGPPGTGKTTFVRTLIQECDTINKRVILVPRALLPIFNGPALVDLLPKLAQVPSVLLIEDAEPMLAVADPGRREEGTSTLLNLTDGLLNDVARTQVICTFNARLDQIDPALLRDGRLLARWEFTALSVDAGRRAAAQLGLDPSTITRPQTIAEIAAFKPIQSPVTKRPVVGL